MMSFRVLAASIGLSAVLAFSVQAQTLILEPSATVLGPGDTFSLKVSINTAGLPIAGFSVFFNMAGTDASGSFIVQAETLSPDWVFLTAEPTLPAVLPDSGKSQDYGNATTPDVEEYPPDLPASASLWLFTLQIQASLATVPGNYTIMATADSLFFYDFLNGGTEVHLPSSSIAVTVVPEPSTLLLALSSVGMLVLLRRKLGSRIENGRIC